MTASSDSIVQLTRTAEKSKIAHRENVVATNLGQFGFTLTLIFHFKEFMIHYFKKSE